MPREIEELYQEIGERLVMKIPPDWLQAWITAEADGGSQLVLNGWYVSEGEHNSHSFQAGPEITQLLIKVFKHIKAVNWHFATFSIDRSGQFELNFEH